MSALGSREGWARAGSWALLAGMLGFVVFCGAWRLDGGRWARVQTPSMGTVAPVGTLLWTKPVPFDELTPGDFITFHPPGDQRTTYSHRVHRLNADGTLTTKGLIPAPDPWRLTAAEVIGEVQMRWWGIGWVVTAAPVLLAGGLLIALVWRWARRSWRLPAAMVLASLTITTAIVWHQPLLGAQQLAFAPSPGGGADATYVGTGLTPIRVRAPGGDQRTLRAGEVGTVHLSHPDRRGRYRVRLAPALPWWWWSAVLLVCLLPGLYSLVIGLPARSDHPRGPRHGGRSSALVA